ncbi:MAG: YgiT-type zinc finger protein [Gemmatimonadetes bacterium]|nr:YgiT-type zinc finger protein [Gemmatimonadota bacterium]MYC12232.1 YgiT-type zinc finger protein [Gemmatimonadota bacterium]MYK52342.1 YgiT-type zinc finger protein [Gemmatimonadota bacterium]
MHCDICGRENAHIHKIDRMYGKGKHTVTIRNIPLAICSTCDERYFAPRIPDKAEQLSPALHKHSESACLV